MDLDGKATQADLAELVGVTRQAIQKQASKVPFPRNGTLRQWLLVYCDHMREQASGRVGTHQDALTAARVAESSEKTLALKLANQEALGNLVQADTVAALFDELFTAVPVLITSTGARILDGVESKHQVKLEDELVNEPLRSAASSIADLARKLGGNVRAERYESGPAAADINGGVGNSISAASN